MRRIGLAVILAVSLCAGPLAIEGQQATKVYRIGYLFENPRPASGEDFYRNLFRQRGYIEGHNAVFEFRWAGGRVEQLAVLADELVRLRVDVIMTGSTPTASAAKFVETRGNGSQSHG